MANKHSRGRHPNSIANLSSNAGRFAADAAAAEQAGRRSGAARKGRAKLEAVLESNLAEAVELLCSDISQEHFRQIASCGRNQMQRIIARSFSDSRTAFASIQWVFDRLQGRSVQMIRQQTELQADAAKPVIVFRSTERKQTNSED